MMSDWKEFNLLEVFGVTNGLSKNRKEFGFGHPFLTFKEVFSNYFVPEELVSLANTTEKERNKCSIKRGDVFITRTSEKFEELGITCVSLKDYPNATFNGFTKRLRPNNKAEINPEYSSFYFKSPYFRQQILSLTTMTTRASLNNEMLERLTIVLPPLDKQKEIAKVLVDLNKKIELNRQINQTLEQIAQAIFKSWFVDFDPVKAKIAAKQAGASPEQIERAAMCAISGISLSDPEEAYAKLDQLSPETQEQLKATAALFPDVLVESELGKIPEGWEVDKVKTVVKRLKPKKRYTKKQVVSFGKIPVYEQGADILLGYHNNPPGFIASSESPIFIFGDHTCIMHLSCEPFDISQNVIPLVGDDCPTMWVYYATQGKQKFQEYRRHWSEFIIKKVVIPSRKLMDVYGNFATSLYKKQEHLILENNSLKEIRDTLIPKLLSGEITLDQKEENIQSKPAMQEN